MENPLLLVFSILGTLFIGVGASWLMLRGQLAAATERGRAEAQVELATQQERLRASSEELQHLQQKLDAVGQSMAQLQNELNTANQDKAQLSERAARLPALEHELRQAEDRDRATQQDILKLSKSEAEKGQSLQSAQERLAAVKAEFDETQGDLERLTTRYNELSEKLAALEPTAARVPALEESIAAKDALIAKLNADISGLRESQGRLEANLQAEQDSLAETQARLVEASRKLGEAEQQLIAERQKVGARETTIGRLEAEVAAERTAAAAVREELNRQKAAAVDLQDELSQTATDLAELKVQLDNERNQHAEKIQLLTEAREKLTLEFKNLASEILDEKTKRFAEDSQNNMGQLLHPLKERLTEFKTKVEEIHAKEIEQQAMLRTELSQLKELNRQITEEAHGLATALKGQAKTQGNWGELVLENVLDRAGLCEGKDFRREVSFNTEDGRKRPDVIVSLPQNKHLVIDAKVSLNAYTRYVNAESDAMRTQALKEHVTAIASRIQELSDRSYFALPGLNTPEMVFMFIPIESAFVEALRADEELFQRAIANNILVATPTTLLTSLNIVRQLWRFEEQNAHTAELAERAAKVYKKLVTFLSSMEQIGTQLDKAKETYTKAMGQLVHGKGNLIQQANDFERLGVSIQTPLPEHLVTKAALELDYMEPPRE